jgi:alkylation response protein AidB-like acyl-CoA dehydrogenase
LKGVKGVSLRRIHNSGVNASGSTFIEFDEVLVPKENLIGAENQGFRIVMSNFNAERLSLAIGAVRLARTCFAEAFNRALQRRTFGRLLIENQIIRAKFASMARAIESCHAWVEQMAATYSDFQQQKFKGTGQDLKRDESLIGSQIALLKVQSGKVLKHYGLLRYLSSAFNAFAGARTLLQGGAADIWGSWL